MKQLTTLLTALAVICFFGTAAFALDIGGDVKVLGYWAENVTDTDDDRDDQDDFLRTETHLWFQADLSDNVTTRICVETDRAFDDDSEGGQNNLDVFLEEAWIQAMYLYDSAISAKLGRQFIEFGDGFIIGDADPGSEASLNTKGEWEVDPFDAILVWYDGDDWVLNAILAKAVENRVESSRGDGDADVYGLYFTYSGVEDWVFDLYGFFANVEDSGSLPFGSHNADLFCVGARFAGSAYEGLSYKLEGAYEFGDIDIIAGTADADLDVSAWAIEAGIKYAFDAEYNPWLGFTYVYLSGDDDGATDGDIDGFYAPFENRTYGEILDPNSNVHIFNLAGGFDVNEDVAVTAKYYYFLADEDGPYGGDDDIGHEVDAFLDYQFSEETTATLAAGVFIPEDAVENVNLDDDLALFVRAGVKVEF